MKKIYFAPETKTVKVGMCQMVCASNGLLSTSEDDKIEDASGFGARRGGSFWDDDDEEEY